MSGRRDHFLPAAYIGGFSSSTVEKSRDRSVWVNDKVQGIAEARACDVAYVTGLYDLPDPNPSWLGDSIDRWGYESKLPTALQQLATSPVFDARLWIRNLVPFVAGLFSRGPDANRGVNDEGRVMQFQEHLAPVMVSNWTVLHLPQATLPTSDRALAPTKTSAGDGYVVPVSPDRALLLTRSSNRQLGYFKKKGWYVRIPHVPATVEDQTAIVASLAGFALSSIYGPTRASVAIPSASIGTANKVWPTLLVSEQDCDLICHVYDYFRVASAFATEPSQAQAAANRIDLGAITKDWTFPIAVVMNHKERTRGCVVAEDHAVYVSVDLGIGIKRLRRIAGDAIRGSFVIAPIQHMIDLGKNLGDDCIERDDGRANRTYLRDANLKAMRRVDLPPRGLHVPDLPAFAAARKTRKAQRLRRR